MGVCLCVCLCVCVCVVCVSAMSKLTLGLTNQRDPLLFLLAQVHVGVCVMLYVGHNVYPCACIREGRWCEAARALVSVCAYVLSDGEG